MNTGVVSISGFNFRALIAYCRFADSAGFKIHLWAKDEADPVFLSKYASWVYGTRDLATLNIEDLLIFIEKIKCEFGYEKILLLPISEYFNRFILENRQMLEACNAVVPLVSDSLYTAISDKYSFGRICGNYGLLVPKEVDFLEENLPFVAKPRSYSNLHKPVAGKPYLLKTKNDLKKFIADEFIDDFYFQEFITGNSFYLLFFLSRDGRCYRLSQKNLVQQSNGRSIIAAHTATLHQEKICDDYIGMLKNIGFYGLIMIELKKNNNLFYMIEANPRIWGPSQLVLNSGGEIIREFFMEYGISELSKYFRVLPVEDQYYYWSGGVIEDTINQSLSDFHGDGRTDFYNNYKKYLEADVFLQKDTVDLYMKQSKGMGF